MTLSMQLLSAGASAPEPVDWAVRGQKPLIPVQAPASLSPVDLPDVPPSGEAAAFEGLLRAITPLHDGNAACWETALRELSAAIPGSQGLWIEHAPTAHRALRRAFTSARFGVAYLGGFHLLDPLAREDCVCHMAAMTQPMRIDEVVEPRMFERSAFAWNFLTGQGGLAHGLGVCFPVGPDRLARLWLFRPREMAFQDYEVRVLGHFAAQAGRILSYQARHEQVVSERTDAVALLDELAAPCFIVDQDAKLLFANAAARRLIRRGGPLSVRGDVLNGASDAAGGDNPIAALIEKHQSLPGRGARKNEFAAAMLDDGSNHPARWFAFATRLRSAGRGEKPRYAIIVRDAGKACTQIGEEQLQQLFGFTPTEVRVVQALLEGHTTDAIARAMSVRCDTVRSHIKSLLAKTGSRSHAELQKLLMRIAPEFEAG